MAQTLVCAAQRLFLLYPLRPKNLTEKKYVREQRTQMDRRVQVVDQLRADRTLSEHQFHGGQ